MQHIHRFAAGDLALVVASHTIRDDVETMRIIAKERVLVVLSLAPDVGARHRLQLHETPVSNRNMATPSPACYARHGE